MNTGVQDPCLDGALCVYAVLIAGLVHRALSLSFSGWGVCVCVSEREGEGERGSQAESKKILSADFIFRDMV